jgi:hypothetical protein
MRQKSARLNHVSHYSKHSFKHVTALNKTKNSVHFVRTHIHKWQIEQKKANENLWAKSKWLNKDLMCLSKLLKKVQIKHRNITQCIRWIYFVENSLRGCNWFSDAAHVDLYEDLRGPQNNKHTSSWLGMVAKCLSENKSWSNVIKIGQTVQKL